MQELERAHADGLNIALWASLPCTAGTLWFRLNQKFAGVRAENAVHVATFHKLMDNFTILAERVVAPNGDLHWEWPTHCGLWKDPKVQNMIQYLSMHMVNLHGCALGLASIANCEPTKKPWTIATTSCNMHSAFKSALCPGIGAHLDHAQCAGAETRRTEEYTDPFADLVHEGILQDTMDISGVAAVAEAAKEITPDTAAGEHRERVPGPGLWRALVTKTPSPKDPLSRSPKAPKALQAELDDLRAAPTWDEENPLEFDVLIKMDPKAHIARLFPIIGVKNFEDPDEEQHRWKGRIVLGGHAIKTVTGDRAVFNDIGSVPSTMAAARIALACSAVTPGSQTLQSDCVRAYIQALLDSPGDVNTYIELPRAWWPASWMKFNRPVANLLRALYGHPRAGDFWHAKLDAILTKLGFEKHEAWPSVYILKASIAKGEMCIIVVHVDDLITGTPIVQNVTKQLKTQVVMDEPTPIGKYL